MFGTDRGFHIGEGLTEMVRGGGFVTFVPEVDAEVGQHAGAGLAGFGGLDSLGEGGGFDFREHGKVVTDDGGEGGFVFGEIERGLHGCCGFLAVAGFVERLAE
jgi:hypothetical protein